MLEPWAFTVPLPGCEFFGNDVLSIGHNYYCLKLFEASSLGHRMMGIKRTAVNRPLTFTVLLSDSR
jgi:hypothetical protein